LRDTKYQTLKRFLSRDPYKSKELVFMNIGKILVCAHPDDEALWFNPNDYWRIVIVFGRREDKSDVWNEKRREAVKNHPFGDRIIFLNFKESNYWRDPSKKAEYDQNFLDLCEELRKIDNDLKPESITTHDANGEYGHADHKLCFNACMETFKCPVNGKDPKIYRQIKEHYQKYDVWTW
jgi:LmbE family N-acetylglucosaminyl deacetylase